jgi:hypothetical protein
MPGTSQDKPGHDECRHLDSKHAFTTSPRNAPEALLNLSAQRGRGERRMPVAPAASCAIVVVERTRVTTSTPESPDVPARNGFTTYFVLSPVIGLSCHRHPADMVCPRPVGPTSPPLDLTPASRRQDHTTSPYAATSLVRSLGDRSRAFRQPALQSRRAQNAAASTASAPRVRDDRDTPLWWGGMRKVLDVIWGEWEPKYFSENQK